MRMLLVVTAILATAQEPDDRIRSLAALLDADSPDARDRAEKELVEIGPPALPAMRALRGGEAGARARRVVEAIEWRAAEPRLSKLWRSPGDLRRVRHPLLDKWVPHYRLYRRELEPGADRATRNAIVAAGVDGSILEVGSAPEANRLIPLLLARARGTTAGEVTELATAAMVLLHQFESEREPDYGRIRLGVPYDDEAFRLANIATATDVRFAFGSSGATCVPVVLFDGRGRVVDVRGF
jgi:hypothetical protein